MLPPVGIEPWPLIALHEQKFKNLLSSTYQVSVERRVLDLGSEALRGRFLFPLEVTFCHWILFHVVKFLMQILALLTLSSSL